MPYLSYSSYNRPNRAKETKNKDYHRRYARWVLASRNDPLHQNFIGKAVVNWNFYRNNQWIFDEDLETFFMDESGDVRNRIKITKNIIAPIVRQYVGNAVRMEYNVEARNISKGAINRRERELARLKMMTRIAQRGGRLSELIRNKLPVGRDAGETEDIFRNLWTDGYEDDINNFMQYVAEENDFDQKKIQLAKFLAVFGIGIYKGYEYNGKYASDVVDPFYFGFDRSAQRPDLRDAEYMWEYGFWSVSGVLERWQNIPDHMVERLEQFSHNQQANLTDIMRRNYGITGSKVPVYETYWKDYERRLYGYVKDEFGYPYFARIDGERFSKEDLIDPPEDVPERIKKIIGADKAGRTYVETLRTATVIPAEEVGSTSDGDLLLEHGEAPYQEEDELNPFNVRYPYKVNTWDYSKGEVRSPIDDVIDPQRFINRMFSVAEARINNSGSAGTVIAKEAIDPRDGEESVKRAIKKGDPVTVEARKLGSVQNSIQRYDGTTDALAGSIFQWIREMGASVQDTTGVNEAMTGTLGGPQQKLVGVLEQQVQMGTLIQEDFYNALTNILKQAYHHIARVGLRIYVQSDREIAVRVGDEGAHRLKITKELESEIFRIFIKRSVGEATQVDNGNNMAVMLLQAKLIDRQRFANLFNRSTPNDVAKALREYQSEVAEAERIQAQRQKEREQQAAGVMEQASEQQRAQEQADKMEDRIEREKGREHDLDKIVAREAAKKGGPVSG